MKLHGEESEDRIKQEDCFEIAGALGVHEKKRGKGHIEVEENSNATETEQGYG